MQKPDISDYMTAGQLIDWAMEKINLCKLREELTDHDIAEIMQWIGICACDTIILSDDFPIIRRIGIGLMLTVTLLEFPEFYVKYRLSQFN
jgi:hypothetical protein